MNKYNDLELSILSILLQKPELMNEVILDDKYFVKYKKIWLFMKAFYNKFHNFDFNLMLSVSKDKYRMMEYIIWIIEKEPNICLFKEYQEQLINLYEESKKDKYIIDKVYELANDLFVRNIEVSEFRNKVDKIYENADEIFKND